MDIWDLLERDAPNGCEAVQDLFSWSLNYDPGKGPFSLFIDLIGYSTIEDIYSSYNGEPGSLGFLECEKLGNALLEYANEPYEVKTYVATLMNADT
jgi:hypothetical protein